MPSELEKQLITAAVDGELSPEQGQAFRELLARSQTAATLYAALLADRERLRSLARPAAPQDLWASIQAHIPQAIPRAPKPAHPFRRALVPAGMAASFLLAVGAGAHWLASSQQPQRLAKNQLQQLPKDDLRLTPPDRLTPPMGDEQPDTESPEATQPVGPPMPPAVVVTNDAPPKTADSSPGPKPADLLTAPSFGSDVKAFDRVAVKLPLLSPFADFANSDSQNALRERLGLNAATRVDLFAKDSARAVELLTQAGKSVNLNLIVETIAGERMKRKMPSTWIVYTDALTPAEITKWLGAAAEAEAAPSPSGNVFGISHVLAATAHEQKETQQLLGIDLGLTKKLQDPPANAHISSKTLEQVTSAIQKGDPAKPAILLTYLPPLVRVHPALSKDVKQFHELRKDRKPGTVPVMIVVRPSNG
ncbi:hypothetical protein [Limnoglobus roseus]|uniref:Uncharacterized protein n=1 Tax=Limnoglobus roseus TaxID=2598579 RepID=A0A5C1AMJ1_9BACT|nr:hypothetical protein [Limnoglobus roseus]QEL18424.1 hypothetical protein PX52LOC_05449 [Limnoglobus roseus]